MSQAFGHNAWLGLAEEVTYGTGVSPTKFLEINSEAVKTKQQRIGKATLRSPSQRYSVKSKKDVGGPFAFWLPFEGAEMVLKHTLGSFTTATAESGRYVHTFALASNLPVGLTLHVNRDAGNIGGSSAFQYVGCQITKFGLKQSIEDMLACDVEVIGRDVTNVAVATPTFPTYKQIDWEMAILSIGGTGYYPRDIEINIENSIATDRFTLGDRRRVGVGRNGARKISGKFTLEFNSLTLYTDFLALTNRAIIVSWIGPTLVSSTYALSLTFPVAGFTGEEPDTKDAGPITQTISFEGFANTADNDELVLTLTNSTATP